MPYYPASGKKTNPAQPYILYLFFKPISVEVDDDLDLILVADGPARVAAVQGGKGHGGQRVLLPQRRGRLREMSIWPLDF